MHGLNTGRVVILVLTLAGVSLAAGVATAGDPPIYTAAAAPKLEALSLQESVSRWGITWTFEKPARVGQFVNGDWYVVGEVTVKAIDPRPLWDNEVKNVVPEDKEKSGGKYVRNGCILNINPTDTAKSGFDSRCSKYYPGFAWIETAGAKPEEVRAAVVAAIAKGATGIGDRGFEGYGDEKPDASLVAELKRLNDQITSHAEQLCKVPAKATESLK